MTSTVPTFKFVEKLADGLGDGGDALGQFGQQVLQGGKQHLGFIWKQNHKHRNNMVHDVT